MRLVRLGLGLSAYTERYAPRRHSRLDSRCLCTLAACFCKPHCDRNFPATVGLKSLIFRSRRRSPCMMAKPSVHSYLSIVQGRSGSNRAHLLHQGRLALSGWPTRNSVGSRWLICHAVSNGDVGCSGGQGGRWRDGGVAAQRLVDGSADPQSAAGHRGAGRSGEARSGRHRPCACRRDGLPAPGVGR